MRPGWYLSVLPICKWQGSLESSHKVSKFFHWCVIAFTTACHTAHTPSSSKARVAPQSAGLSRSEISVMSSNNMPGGQLVANHQILNHLLQSFVFLQMKWLKGSWKLERLLGMAYSSAKVGQNNSESIGSYQEKCRTMTDKNSRKEQERRGEQYKGIKKEKERRRLKKKEDVRLTSADQRRGLRTSLLLILQDTQHLVVALLKIARASSWFVAFGRSGTVCEWTSSGGEGKYRGEGS